MNENDARGLYNDRINSYGKIGTKRMPKPVTMVMCDCGHEVEKGLVMSASLGTSCPDCYDSMSD